MTRPLDCYIINLQPALGGAEVFTMFFARAVRAAGCRTVLYVNPQVQFWNHLAADGVEIRRVSSDMAILEQLAAEETAAQSTTEVTTKPATQRADHSDAGSAAPAKGSAWIVTHAPVSPAFVEAARTRHWLTGFCHMPLAGRSAGVLTRYHLVYGVSAYVLSTLAPAGVMHAYGEPVYGMAELERGFGPQHGAIRRRPLYSWDKRKVRDRLLALAAPVVAALAAPLASTTPFARRPGVTLGIVSNIGPIKQFDVLFGVLVPHLLQRPQINLEIFGTGGYRSVRDLEAVLAPLQGRARFWGHQDDPRAIYPQLDYLMSGLPEKEALGLNIIEAQVSGTPVLAVDAPPFTETVLDRQTGYLYPDPRHDGGAGFARVLDQALAAPRLAPLAALAHLEKFSRTAFDARVARMVEHAARSVHRPSAGPQDGDG